MIELTEQNGTLKELLTEHDNRFDAIDVRLDKRDAVLDRIALELSKKADKADMDARFDAVDSEGPRGSRTGIWSLSYAARVNVDVCSE